VDSPRSKPAAGWILYSLVERKDCKQDQTSEIGSMTGKPVTKYSVLKVERVTTLYLRFVAGNDGQPPFHDKAGSPCHISHHQHKLSSTQAVINTSCHQHKLSSTQAVINTSCINTKAAIIR
jgi:hypothetical protein